MFKYCAMKMLLNGTGGIFNNNIVKLMGLCSCFSLVCWSLHIITWLRTTHFSNVTLSNEVKSICVRFMLFKAFYIVDKENSSE